MKRTDGALCSTFARCCSLIACLLAPAALGQSIGLPRPSGPPTALVANPASTSFTLAWQPAPGATTYMVWIAGKGTNTNGTTQFAATNLTPSTKYDVTVTPVAGTWRYDGATNGPPAMITVTTLAATQLAVPTNLTAVKGATSLHVSWTGSPGATSYNVIYTKTAGSGYLPGCTSASTTCTIANLAPGTLYYVYAYAAGPNGQSQMSAPLATSTSKTQY